MGKQLTQPKSPFKGRLVLGSALTRGKQPAPETARPGRVGIIDIGSNSIRLVVYEGQARIPSILFNEKVMAGLGRGLAATGAIDAEALDRAITALARFARLAEEMGVTDLTTVATAAVRDASNGHVLLDRLAGIGLPVRLLSGEEEASLSAEGLLAGIPDADGIVGDLGGGSLELVRVSAGRIAERASFPLGVLRVAAIRKRGGRSLAQVVGKALKQGGWGGRGQGLPFYMIGGSWRALALLDMHLTGYRLPIVHQYRMAPDNAAYLVRVLARLDKRRLKAIPAISSSRAPSLPDAAALLAMLVKQLGSSALIVSAYGLREGLLHNALPPELRDADPLIEATREEGRRQGRFPEHGDLLHRWIAPLFAGETPADERLRHAACLLGDVGWRAHPDFRAERGLETALHGNWVGVDARGRGMMGQALFTSFGGTTGSDIVQRVCTDEEISRAVRWGLAMRLAQRLSGGVAPPLEASRLALGRGSVVLHLARGDLALYGEAVERRHKALALAFGMRPEVVTP